jgi:hypothetical protein
MKERKFKISETERVCLGAERTIGKIYKGLMEGIVIVGAAWFVVAGIRQFSTKKR